MVPAVSCTVNEAGVKGRGPSCVRGGLQRAVVGSVAALALQWDRRLRAALTSVAYAIEYLLRRSICNTCMQHLYVNIYGHATHMCMLNYGAGGE